MAEKPDWERYSAYFSEIGRKGGLSRAKRLSAERRREIATKAAKAATVVRKKKAKQRKKERKAAQARWAKRKGPKPS